MPEEKEDSQSLGKKYHDKNVEEEKKTAINQKENFSHIRLHFTGFADYIFY